jgi:acyl carrier protein
MDITTTPLAESILRCSAAALNLKLNLSELAITEDTIRFVHGERPVIAGVTVDSLDLQEVLATLEDELGIDLFGIDDLSRISTLGRLVGYLEREAKPERLGLFYERWTPGR